MYVYILLDHYESTTQVVSAHATCESAEAAMKRMFDSVGGDYTIQEAQVEE